MSLFFDPFMIIGHVVVCTCSLKVRATSEQVWVGGISLLSHSSDTEMVVAW